VKQISVRQIKSSRQGIKMSRSKRTEIRTETREMWIVHRAPLETAAADCGECPEPSPLISMTEACSLTGITSEIVCALMATGAIHFSVASDGQLLICTRTLCRSQNEMSKLVG
jgi:hypothetical protein